MIVSLDYQALGVVTNAKVSRLALLTRYESLKIQVLASWSVMVVLGSWRSLGVKALQVHCGGRVLEVEIVSFWSGVVYANIVGGDDSRG